MVVPGDPRGPGGPRDPRDPSDNPFGSPSGDPPPPMPPAVPDWQHPAYQQQWPTPEPRPRARLIPRGLVAACHTSAVGAWTFVVSVAFFASLLTGDDAWEGLLLFLTLGAFFVTALTIGGTVAVIALAAAIPLAAVWWGERHEREGDGFAERVAFFHLGVAWLAAGYCLVRILF